MRRKEAQRLYNEVYRAHNRLKINASQKAFRQALRAETFQTYGVACAKCGFSDSRALQIAHIENNGAEERKRLGGQHIAGWRFYHWLKKMGWPSGYQTLCANCNAIKQVEKLASNAAIDYDS